LGSDAKYKTQYREPSKTGSFSKGYKLILREIAIKRVEEEGRGGGWRVGYRVRSLSSTLVLHPPVSPLKKAPVMGASSAN